MRKILLTIVVIGVLVIGVRLLLGGNEDEWICTNRGWVEHGKPQAPRPSEPCGVEDEASLEEAPIPEEELIGGQRDEGGCLIGAGYSWCEAKAKCLRPWEEPCE